MKKIHFPLTNYDFLKCQIYEYYKHQFDHTTPQYKKTIIEDMKNALFGLEVLSDNKIRKLVETPQNSFYIIHNIPILKKSKPFFQSHNLETETQEKSYGEVIKDLCRLGHNTQKIEKFRGKVRPLLIIAAVLSAGFACYASKTNRNPRPAIAGSVAALAALAYNKLQSDLLPPTPKIPDLTR